MDIFKITGTIALNGVEDANRDIDGVTGNAESASERLGSVLSKVGNIALKVGEAAVAAIGAVATGVAALTKESIEEYADYEQLVGGVETLFKDSSDKVVQYANNAYKTAGLSANDYMETVTGFSASLLQSLGNDTEAAADMANMAITDMSDNANKMGTDMSSIQNAYQGFAKQNYTMLDNLKLGYGGTKEEMERLLEDATALSGVEYDVSSYADIVEAIHVVQSELGITGTTSKEASTTIQGSIGMMKSAWQNFLTGMADPTQDFDELVQNLIDSVVTAADNIVPRISMALPRLIEGLSAIIQNLAPYIPGILSELLPALVSGATTLLSELTNNLPDILETILPGLGGELGQTIVNVIGQIYSLFQSFLPILIQITSDLLPIIAETIDALLPQLIQFVTSLLPVLLELFQAILPLIESLVPLLSPILEIIIATIDPLIALLESIIPIIDIIVQLSTVIITWMVPSFRMWGQILTTVSTLFRTFAGDAKNVWMVVADVVRVGCEAIKTLMVGTFNYIEGKVFPIFENIRAGIKKIFTLPKVSISPKGWSANDLLKGKMPSFSVDWYAKAMDEPMIMTRPTAFGMNSNGQIMAGGEAGSEVVSGTNTLMGMISSAVAAQTSRTEEVLMNILELLSVYIPELSRMQMVMDSGVLVGQLAPGIDAELGKLAFRSERGV